MSLLREELYEMGARAASIDERRAECSGSSRPASDGPTAERIAAWRRLIAQDQPALFERRLAWDGLRLDALGCVVTPPTPPKTGQLPGWVEVLGSVLDEVEAQPSSFADASGSSPLFLEATNRIPFAHGLAPLVNVAARRLAERTGESPGCDRLSADAMAGLKRDLLRRLSEVCGPSLLAAFLAYRAVPRKEDLADDADLSDIGRRYDRFVCELIADRYRSFFKDYCVLARLTMTVIDSWTDAAAELLHRLEEDWTELCKIFGNGRDPGLIEAIKSDLSDPHSEGRTVMILSFTSGLRLVYKPRPVDLEAAFSSLLEWCNRQDGILRMRTPAVLDCSSYGWMEFVEARPCAYKEAVVRYYRRAGTLLCVVYALNGTDFHARNIIASGEHPVLIDLESLLHPFFAAWVAEERDDAQRLAHSVLRTGLLPRTSWEERDEVYDASGLACVPDQQTSILKPVWKHINTDQMSMIHEPHRTGRNDNLPTLSGRQIVPDGYVAEIQQGFESMYHVLLKNREDLQRPDGVLSRFANAHTRIVFRSTALYRAIHNNALHPSFLRHGIDRSIQFDALCKPMLYTTTRPPLWPVVRAERCALERLDIPRFTVRCDATGMSVDDGELLLHCFEETPLESVVARLNDLCPDDLERQTALIRSALAESKRTTPMSSADSVATE